jgi:hypothetical protein
MEVPYNKRCVFPLGNDRCSKERKNNYHCKEHFKTAIILYKKCKEYRETKLNIINDWITDDETLINKMMDCDVNKLALIYSTIGKFYDMRQKYKNLYFVKNCWYEEHDQYMGQLTKIMILIEDIIKGKYVQNMKKSYYFSDSNAYLEEYIPEYDEKENDSFWKNMSSGSPETIKKICMKNQKIIDDLYWDPEIKLLHKRKSNEILCLEEWSNEFMDNYLSKNSSYYNKDFNIEKHKLHIFTLLIKTIFYYTDITIFDQSILITNGYYQKIFTCHKYETIQDLWNLINDIGFDEIPTIKNILNNSKTDTFINSIIYLLTNYPYNKDDYHYKGLYNSKKIQIDNYYTFSLIINKTKSDENGFNYNVKLESRIIEPKTTEIDNIRFNFIKKELNPMTGGTKIMLETITTSKISEYMIKQLINNS